MFDIYEPGRNNPITLESAIIQTLYYAHIFKFPLTIDELHRYLVRFKISKMDLIKALPKLQILNRDICLHRGYYFLKGHQDYIQHRENNWRVALKLWPVAIRYARKISAFPFIKMVALSGALAVGNEPQADIDYFVVAQPGRLWVSRAWILIYVKIAHLQGLELCPNYMVTTNCLTFKERNLYTAHEIAHMIPLTGYEIYTQIREHNNWIFNFLPNAQGMPEVFPEVHAEDILSFPFKIVSKLLDTRIGDWLENWERSRKITKLTRDHRFNDESEFSKNICKGHFGGYQTITMDQFKSSGLVSE